MKKFFLQFCLMFCLFIVLCIIMFNINKYLMFPKEKLFTNIKKFPIIWSNNLSNNLTSNIQIANEGKLLYAVKLNGGLFIADSYNGNILKKINIPLDYKDLIIKYYSGRIYLLTNKGYLCCVDMSGNVLYTNKISSQGIYPAEIFVNDNVLILANYAEGNIASIDKDTGQIIKATSVQGYIASVNLQNKILYYSQSGYNVYALDCYNLQKIWEYDEHVQHTHSEPKFLDGKIYLNNYNQMIIFDAYNGNEIKRYDLNAIEFNIDGNFIYSANGSIINKVVRNSGKVIWSLPVDTNKLFYTKDGVFYMDNTSRQLVKISKETGKVLWRSDLNGYSVSKIFNNKNIDIILRDDNALLVLNRETGEALWKLNAMKTRAGIEDRKINLYNDIMLVSKNDNILTAYQIK